MRHKTTGDDKKHTQQWLQSAQCNTRSTCMQHTAAPPTVRGRWVVYAHAPQRWGDTVQESGAIAGAAFVSQSLSKVKVKEENKKINKKFING